MSIDGIVDELYFECIRQLPELNLKSTQENVCNKMIPFIFFAFTPWIKATFPSTTRDSFEATLL